MHPIACLGAVYVRDDGHIAVGNEIEAFDGACTSVVVLDHDERLALGDGGVYIQDIGAYGAVEGGGAHV